MIKTTNIILDSFLISSEIELTDAFIKGAERVFRDSFEYKKLLAYYRNDEDQNTCLFIKDIDFSSKGLTLEFHHIIRLYDLVLIVIRELLSKGMKNISTFDVANRLMELHYQNLIPFTFLSKTMHQVQHSAESDKRKIEISSIKGNYKKFLTDFADYIDKDQWDTIEKELGERWQDYERE